MDSLSFKNTKNVGNVNNNQVSFTGQKSIMDTQGAKKFRFYAPPYDKSKYNLALELIHVKDEKKGSNNTGNLVTDGQPLIMTDSTLYLSNDMCVDIDADNTFFQGKDMIGYRFVLIDPTEYKKTHDLKASQVGYLLDSSKAAEGEYGKFSYFSQKQGVVNKKGPMYHIFPDSYNVKDKDDFVRNHFNKAGGNIQGMIKKLREKDSELDPYEMIISTPLFGGDDISSHGYWTANPYQISASKGTLEDFRKLQTEIFDAGKSYVADGAFTSQGFQGVQLQNVLKWGKDSPNYHWFKLDRPDSPNLNIKLGVLPDSIVPNSDKNSETSKKAEHLKENIAFKVVNPKYIQAGDTPDKVKPNPNYDKKKTTYIQFYDKRFAGKQGDDIQNLITSYDKDTLDNHYEVTDHQDSVMPYYFAVDPDDNRFKTKGASLKDLETKGYMDSRTGKIRKGYDAFFEFGNYTITTKGQSGGSTAWDGSVDLVKMNIANPTKEGIVGNKQVKNYLYNLANYWTKTTDNTILEHLASDMAARPEQTIRNLSEKYNIDEYELEDLYNGVEPNNNKTFKEQIKDRVLPGVITQSVIDFPLESVELSPDITGVLSTDFITPRPARVSDNEKWSKTKFLDNLPEKSKTMYKDYMYKYSMSVLGELDKRMPDDKKIFDQKSGIPRLTPYGKMVLDLSSNDIMRFGVVKSLFPDQKVYYDSQTNVPVFDKSLKTKGLSAINVKELTPRDEADAVVDVMSKGFKNLAKHPDEDFVDHLYKRFADINLNDYKFARAVMDKTGAGLNWRFDAAKDVADLDQRRAYNRSVTFEKCWDGVIDFWSGFIENVRNVNPASYIVAEVTNLWEFSRYSESGKNALTREDVEMFNKMDEPTQKAMALRFFHDNKELIGARNVSEETQKAVANMKDYEIYSNPNMLTAKQFAELKEYYVNQDGQESAMFRKDFGKYVDPDIAERMLYDKTGATTGSNYSTFFGLYPELFGQNYEHGTVSTGRLYNMGEFEGALKGFFRSGSAQFINGSHIFTNNHDKPRPLQIVALDGNLFLGNLQSPEHKQRAKAVTGSTDYDNMSSMGVAVGEAYVDMFKAAGKKLGISENSPQMKTIKQAIADLTVGKYLNYTKPDMQRSRAFGFTPFDITMKDVILQARYLSETKGMAWDLSGGKKSSDKELSKKEMTLYNETFRQLTPAMDKIASMWEMMCCTVGIPTLFAGDEFGQSGYETPTKNVELAIRNLTHHEWVDDPEKGFIRDCNKKMTAVAGLHKRPELSALADGSPLIVPQNDTQNRSALYKYNDNESGVLVVYSNAQMPDRAEIQRIEREIDKVKDGKDPIKEDKLRKQLDKIAHAEARKSLNKNGSDKVDGIDLGYVDPNQDDGNRVMGNVASKGTEFKRVVYDEKSGRYVDDGKIYIVDGDGKLKRGTRVDKNGNKLSRPIVAADSTIELNNTTNIFYKVA